MKNVKFLIALVLFCAMGYTGYITHEKMEMSDAEKFVKANIEALTGGESSGGGVYEYPNGYQYTSRCNVRISKFTKCAVEIIACPGGGNGCNTKKCPVHGK